MTSFTPFITSDNPHSARHQAVHPSVDSLLKRLIDIVGALVGLTLTAVLWLPIAIAIKLDSPGPVLYSQLRCGHRGQIFRIWKFRSMVTDAEHAKHLIQNQASGHIFKNDEDPRITNVGKFLRRTSLDEFPQFWNVLLGSMSLVGTRPPTVDEVKHYTARHWHRLEVKPGITGEWQAKGRSHVLDFETIIEMDLTYQQHWSIGYDLQLIWKTVWVVLARKGAY